MYTVHNWSMKTNLEDFTVGEFEKIITILNNPLLENIEKYFDIFEFLGMPESILNDLTDDEFFELIQQFNLTSDHSEMKPSIEVDGRVYRAYPDDGEFILRAKDLSHIEKTIKNEPNYVSKILAIILKREDLGPNEHWTSAHIVHKAKLFRDLNAKDMWPYIYFVTNKINNKLKDYVSTAE